MTVWAGLVPVGGHIAPAMGEGKLHVQRSLWSQGRDSACSGFRISTSLSALMSPAVTIALTGGLDVHRLGALAVQLGNDAFYVQDDFSDVLLHTGDGGELMLHAVRS